MFVMDEFTFQPRNEVRFAVVMYGGISLAIYMNGIAQELLSLVRSTAPDVTTLDDNGGDGLPSNQLLIKESEITGTSKVYREMAKALWKNAAKSNEIGTRFVVDILSGTSAGGLNGLFLANALVNEPDAGLDPLTKLWIEEGEIGKLLNDKESIIDATHVSLEREKQALLNSDRMLRKLVDALNAFDYRSDPPAGSVKSGEVRSDRQSNLVDELDLYMHTTDLNGLSLPLEMGDGTISERRNRTTFHFRYDCTPESAPELPQWKQLADTDRSYPKTNPPLMWNDFRRSNVPLMAFVGRCTSSIVPAFEPMRMDDLSRVLPAAPFKLGNGIDAQGYDPKRSPFLYSPYFRDYWQNAQLVKVQGTELIESAVSAFAFRNFGDGGYLDNYPFADAVDRLKARRASLPVDRKLLYVEPDPALETSDELYIPQAERLNVVKHAVLSRTLPWDQKIREQIQKIRERNVLLERVRQVVTDIKSVDLEQDSTSAKLKNLSQKNKPKTESSSSLTPAETAYIRLRVASATDGITDLLANAFGYDQDGKAYRALSFLTKAWRDYQYPGNRGGDSSLAAYSDFLNSFDFEYRLRQIDFINVSLNDLLSLPHLDEEKVRDIKTKEHTVPEAPSGFIKKFYELAFSNSQFFQTHAPLIDMKKNLNRIDGELRKAQADFRQSLRPMEHRPVPKELAEAVANLKKLTADHDGSAHISLDDLTRVMEHDTDEKRYRAAQEIFGFDGHMMNPKGELIVSIGRALALFFRAKLGVIDEKIEGSLPKNEPLELALWLKIATASTDHPTYYEKTHYLVPSQILGKFEQVDAATFPIIYGTGALESGRVDVLRVSPQDARSLVSDPVKAHSKLAGTGLGHFSGFFHPMWRREDILWGRLDASERLICAMLPSSLDANGNDENRRVRSNLTLSAQLAILAEGKEAEGASKEDVAIHADLRSDLLRKALDAWGKSLMKGSEGLTPEQDQKLINEFCEKGFIDAGLDYLKVSEVKTRFETCRAPLTSLLEARSKVSRTTQLYERPKLSSTQELALVGRSLNIVGNMFDFLGTPDSKLGKVGEWISRLGSFIVGAAKVVTPGAMEGFWARHWLSLMLFVGSVLGVGGALINTQIEKFGWELAGLSLLLYIVIWIATKDLNTIKPMGRASAIAKAGSIVLLTVLGVYAGLIITAFRVQAVLPHGERVEILNGLAVYLVIALVSLAILCITSLFSPPIRSNMTLGKRIALGSLISGLLLATASTLYYKRQYLLESVGLSTLTGIAWAFLAAFVVLLATLVVADVWAYFQGKSSEARRTELLRKAIELKEKAGQKDSSGQALADVQNRTELPSKDKREKTGVEK